MYIYNARYLIGLQLVSFKLALKLDICVITVATEDNCESSNVFLLLSYKSNISLCEEGVLLP